MNCFMFSKTEASQEELRIEPKRGAATEAKDSPWGYQVIKTPCQKHGVFI
jgi:hypothetical protein